MFAKGSDVALGALVGVVTIGRNLAVDVAVVGAAVDVVVVVVVGSVGKGVARFVHSRLAGDRVESRGAAGLHWLTVGLGVVVVVVVLVVVLVGLSSTTAWAISRMGL